MLTEKQTRQLPDRLSYHILGLLAPSIRPVQVYGQVMAQESQISRSLANKAPSNQCLLCQCLLCQWETMATGKELELHGTQDRSSELQPTQSRATQPQATRTTTVRQTSSSLLATSLLGTSPLDTSPLDTSLLATSLLGFNLPADDLLASSPFSF